MRSTIALLLVLLAYAPLARGSASVRVAHLSPDAPNVDVYVNGDRVLSDLAYLETSDALAVPGGTYQVEVTPAGQTAPVVIDATLTLDSGTAYTVAATGLLADISPLVLVDDTVAVPSEAKVRFVHASPDAPAVDVAVAGGGPVVFGDFEFREASADQALAPGDYDLEVRLAGTADVVLSLGTVTLEPGTNSTFFAVGLVADMTLGATVLVSAEAAPARVRAAHFSPDAPAVDVWVDGSPVLTDVPFLAVSDYLALDSGTYQIQVTPAGMASPVVIDESVSVLPGIAYTLAATGLLGSDDLELTPSIDDRDSLPLQGKVRFVHASPDAPNVDIAVAGGGPILFEDFAFRQIGDSLELDPGTYDLEVRLAGTSTVALALPGVEVTSGINATIYAVGLVGDGSLAARTTIDVDDNFVRGDVNRDGVLDVVDGVNTLLYLFATSVGPFCPDAADVDDNGHLDLSDAVGLLEYLYLSGSQPVAPFPGSGTDLTADSLGCGA